MEYMDARQIEKLRRELLEEIYGGAVVAGLPAMLADEDAIRSAGPDELLKIAQRYGIIR